MLLFSTEFPIEDPCGPQDFFQAIQDWLLGSQHTGLCQDNFMGFPAPGETSIQKGDESLDALQFSSAEEHGAAVRYRTSSDGLEWITTIAFSKTTSGTWVAIRVACESKRPAVRLPEVKKPVLVRTFLRSLGGGSDGALRVGSSPLRLGNTDIEVAARLIRGDSPCRLPIVYVSAGFHGNYIVDGARLAHELAGMAHVVVEPNRPFSLRLRLDVNAENVYGGTVGVYWPDGGGRRLFFLGPEFGSRDEVAQAIFDEIRVALTNRRPLDRCTWAFVQESVSRQSISALRASGSQEVEKYVQTFDKELAATTQRLEDANKEAERLRADLRALEARLAASNGALLDIGTEQDLYPNEVLCIIRDAVADAERHVPHDSRRQHVLAGVLKVNPPNKDVAAINRKNLKGLLRGSRGMNAKIRRGLEEMGFSITEEGKHYKIVFQDDDRYTFTLPKSGSDHRGGLNAASNIGRLLF
jgi:hypothetical protein